MSACRKLDALQAGNIDKLLKDKKEFCSNYASQILLPVVTERYIKSIRLHPKESVEEMSYNLAWELLSIRLLSFISRTSIKKYNERVFELFEPMISIWHKICLDFGTQPGLFRLIEASYLGTVSKQPNLSADSLSKLKIYKSEYRTRANGDLTDCTYLDYGIMGHLSHADWEILQFPVTVFTCDKPSQVNQRLSLYLYMIEKISQEVAGWKIFPQYGCEIYCLEFKGNSLRFVDSVSHAITLPYK